jgi:hypothetical protein
MKKQNVKSQVGLIDTKKLTTNITNNKLRSTPSQNLYVKRQNKVEDKTKLVVTDTSIVIKSTEHVSKMQEVKNNM